MQLNLAPVAIAQPLDKGTLQVQVQFQVQVVKRQFHDLTETRNPTPKSSIGKSASPPLFNTSLTLHLHALAERFGHVDSLCG